MKLCVTVHTTKEKVYSKVGYQHRKEGCNRVNMEESGLSEPGKRVGV